MVDLAGGNARKVVRLCYQGYDNAAKAGTEVTRAMLRNAAREQFEQVSTEDVRRDVQRVLHSNGWRFLANHRFGKKSTAACDYWLPTAEDSAGCAVMLSSSVLDGGSADKLGKRVQSIRTAAKVPVKVVLVINGYLSEQFRKSLAPFDKVLVHDVRGFEADLNAVLQGFRIELEAQSKEDRLAVIHERVEELSRQNSLFRGLLSEILEVSGNQRMIERSVENGLRRVLSGVGRAESRSRDFPAVESLFDYVSRCLSDAISLTEESIDIAFGRRIRGKAVRGVVPDSRSLSMVLDGRIQRGMGVAVISLCEMEALKRSAIDAISRRGGVSEIEEITDRCRMFDEFSRSVLRDGELVMFLDSVFALTGLPDRHQDIYPRSAMGFSEGRFEEEFRSLGENVYGAVRAYARES
jgi:hypothetical protein